MTPGLCLGCRGVGWFPKTTRPPAWRCPGCQDRQVVRPLTPEEFDFLRILRRHATNFASNGDLNLLYDLIVRAIPNRECEHCGIKNVAVTLVRSRTAYSKPTMSAWKRLLIDEEGLGEIPDPNQPSWLCPPCAEAYEAYWDEMWSYVRPEL